jgi:2,4-dienoyl-CoA reductase-like NADH-dependent reductase (Old Yellow Enzyme family)/thioredoxin reductase
MSTYQALLKPFRLKNLTIRNRIMSTSHAPGYAEDGMPAERYQLYHLEKAKGGIGMTMFGGSSSVSSDSPLPFNQLDISTDRIIPYLQQFADRIHAEGAALMCQMTHLGRRGRWDRRDWLPLLSPSNLREEMHRSYAKEMESFDFQRIRKQFGIAARRLKDGGLDGCELILAAHHLLDSFLSPLVNKRTDAYGGSAENRMRFPLEVLAEVREAVGPDFIVGIRIAGNELEPGGLSAADCLAICSRIAASGLIDYLNVYQGHGDTLNALQAQLPDMSYDAGQFLHLASAVRAEVDIPVFHASGIRDLATAARAIAEGHVDMVAMTRAHIADPHLVNKLRAGREQEIRQCVGANYCIDRLNAGEGAACIQNVSTGREARMPHNAGASSNLKKVVVIGGGPGGLEAARLAASRGHRVVLFERQAQLGGQIQLSRAVAWRENMAGITRWLEMEARRLGVEIRLGTEATVGDILAEEPDHVVVATGGRAAKPDFPGAELAVSSWNILTRKVEPARNVLVYDVPSEQQGATVAEFMAERGSLVEIVSPDQSISESIGGTARISFVRRLHECDVILTPGYYLSSIYLEGNSLIAVLKEAYSGKEQEREVDQVVYELGTMPEADLYEALKPHSKNAGEVDFEAFVNQRPQTIIVNPEGRFVLMRIGDAVFSRNIHAAIYDGSRFMRAI